jgi:hypothetical protein
MGRRPSAAFGKTIGETQKGLPMKRKRIAIAAGLLVASMAPAMAHHSFAMFDNSKTITLTGTVKEFEWVNPHSWIHVMVVNPAGAPEEWAFEMGSPGQLAAAGWNKDSVKTGQLITISARPMKDGSHGGSGGMIKDATTGACIGHCRQGGRGLDGGPGPAAAY